MNVLKKTKVKSKIFKFTLGIYLVTFLQHEGIFPALLKGQEESSFSDELLKLNMNLNFLYNYEIKHVHK